MGHIRKEELHESLLNEIEGASNIDLSPYQEKEDEELSTNDKTIVGAINELFQDVDNGKNIIADAIDEEGITGDSTFAAMGEAIEAKNEEISELEDDIEAARDTLADLMLEGGYDISGDEDINSLLELLTISGISVSDIKQIACGDNYTFILKNDGSVYSCGLNEYGQLGLGHIDNSYSFIQVTTNINNDVKQIACGWEHVFILKNDGSIYSCGNNNYGQLGLGTSDENVHSTFTQVTANINNDVEQIVCFGLYTFILKNDGSVYSCGNNNYGQLGLGDTANRTTFTQVTTNINNDIKQIVCGGYHTFILKNDGSVYSCGFNNNGQLGLGDIITRTSFTQVTTNINNDVKQISCGDYHTFILKNDDIVWCCGYNTFGQLGLGDTTNRTTFTQVTTNVKQIACGCSRTFILKNDGSVYSCGLNDYGELGLGDTTNRTTFTQVTSTLNNFKQIVCGGSHVFILKNDGSVWACGNNIRGQLGLGDTTTRYKFTQVTVTIKEF